MPKFEEDKYEDDFETEENSKSNSLLLSYVFR